MRSKNKGCFAAPIPLAGARVPSRLSERPGLFRQRRQRRVGVRGARRDAYPQRADLSARWFTELDGAADVRGGRILVRPLRLCVAANA
jgi:hypothetical protein